MSASGTDTFNKSKWTWRSPSVDKAALDNFGATSNAWSNNHMYRTSYHDMSDKVSIFKTRLPMISGSRYRSNLNFVFE
jgi:hypothetical protein